MKLPMILDVAGGGADTEQADIKVAQAIQVGSLTAIAS